MNDNVKRAIRTFLQGFIGVLVMVAVPILNSMVGDAVAGRDVVINLNAWQTIGYAAFAGGFAALIAWVWNALEDKTGVDVLSPTDRLVGDKALGDGLGSKKVGV